MFLQILANGCVNGCLFALMAVGFAFIYNTTRIFHIAQGAAYTVAGYLCFLFLVRLHWGMLPAVTATLLLTALLGILMEWSVYAPLAKRKASPLVSLLSSIGLYIVLINVLAMLFGNETQVLRPGVEQTLKLGPSVILTQVQVAQVVTACLLLPLILALLKFTPLGKTIRALRDHPSLTVVLGVRLQRVRLIVFALGSALAGVAAVLSALDVGIDPNEGMPALLTASVALIIGGTGIFEGAIVGGMLLGLLQSLVIWKFSARWTEALTFSLLIVFLLFRPQGLMGTRKRVEEATA